MFAGLARVHLWRQGFALVPSSTLRRTRANSIVEFIGVF